VPRELPWVQRRSRHSVNHENEGSKPDADEEAEHNGYRVSEDAAEGEVDR
jgi:hypothetical protein